MTYLDPARVFLAATVATCLATGQAHAGDAVREVEHMATDTSPARSIPETMAWLHTTPKGAVMTLQTAQLAPGHVTTAWWVVINNPAACNVTPCSAEDVIGRASEVGTQITYADGSVNAADGTARFAAFLPSGQVEDGWYAQDFPDPVNAEIHLVLNDHGPLIPEIAASMLTTYRGGCSDDSLPPPFPDTAKADGTPGKNRCQLIQDAIFVQTE